MSGLRMDDVDSRSDELTRENQALRDELEAVRSSRDDLVTTLAHALRSPLQALGMTTDLALHQLRREPDTPFPREAIVARLVRSQRHVAKLKQIVDTAVALTQIAGGRLEIDPEPLDLSDLCREVLAREAEDLSWSGCDCHLQLAPGLTGRWDRLALELALTNLLSNAMRFGRGAPITVRTVADRDAVRLSVRDQGQGIPTGQEHRLFQKFGRLEPQPIGSAGLGVGLWIVKHVASAHGGTVAVESRAGAGATFEMVLPRSA